MTKFLWWCAGATIDILREYPTERTKYQGIGLAVLSTATVAGFAGGYAMHFVFDKYEVAVLWGVIWGIIIFNVDRYIVQTLKKRQGAKIWKQLWIALPRIVVAVFFAMIVSKPLELQIFGKEINQKSDELNAPKIEAERAKLEVEFKKESEVERKLIEDKIDELNRRKSVYETEMSELETRFNDEVQGTSGSGRPGYGAIAKRLEAKIAEKKSELEILKRQFEPLESQLKNLDETYQNRVTDELTKYKTSLEESRGLLARLKALGELAKDPIMGWAERFVFGLFLTLESLPVVVKLLAPMGPYEERLELEEQKASQMAMLKLKNELKTFKKYQKSNAQKERRANEVFLNSVHVVRDRKISELVDNWDTGKLHLTFADFLQYVRIHLGMNQIDVGISRGKPATSAPTKSVPLTPVGFFSRLASGLIKTSVNVFYTGVLMTIVGVIVYCLTKDPQKTTVSGLVVFFLRPVLDPIADSLTDKIVGLFIT